MPPLGPTPQVTKLTKGRRVWPIVMYAKVTIKKKEIDSGVDTYLLVCFV